MSPHISAREAKRADAGGDPSNVGLAAALGAGAIIFIAFYIGLFSGRLPWENPHELKFVFSSANELVRNSQVRTAGVPIGKVTKVEEGPGGTALVTAAIEEHGLPIRKDATAKIRPRLFLEGNFFIDVRPGSPSASELDEGEAIPLSQTSVPVQLDQLASIATKDIRQTFKATFRELVDAASGDVPKRLGATISDLPPLARDLAYVSEATMGTTPRDLSEAIDGTGRTLRAFSRDREALGELVDNFARGSAALAGEQAALRATLRSFDRLTTTGPAELDRINAAFPAIRSTVADVRPVLRAAPPALVAARPAVRQLRLLLRPAELPGLIADARPVVRSLAGFAPIGTKVFQATADPVSCLLRNAIPVLTSPVEDPPHSTGEPAYRDLLYSFAALTSANQTFDGNGHNTRYYAGFSDEILSTQSPLGTLFATAEEPLLGSRPRFNGRAPEFHPEARCTEQEKTDLKAQTGKPDFTPTGRKVRVPDAVRRIMSRGGSRKQVQGRLARALRKDLRRLERAIGKKGVAALLRDGRNRRAGK